MRADEFAQQVVSSGQLGGLMGDILRSKALALVLERATVTDASGRPVDLEALTAPRDADEEAVAEEIAAAELDDGDDLGDDAIDDEPGTADPAAAPGE
jgi:trigger factor